MFLVSYMHNVSVKILRGANTDLQFKTAIQTRADIHGLHGDVHGVGIDVKSLRGGVYDLRSDMHSLRGDVHRLEKYTMECLAEIQTLRKNSLDGGGLNGEKHITCSPPDYDHALQGKGMCI